MLIIGSTDSTVCSFLLLISSSLELVRLLLLIGFRGNIDILREVLLSEGLRRGVLLLIGSGFIVLLRGGRGGEFGEGLG